MFPYDGLLLLSGCGVAIIGFRLYADRSERGRDMARRLYQDANSPQFIRAGITVAPIAATAAILFGVSSVLPNATAAWLFIPVTVFAGTAFLLSYRVPPPLAPRWMRDELARGDLVPARPGTTDWILFWIVLPFVVLGPIAIIALIVVYDSVQP